MKKIESKKSRDTVPLSCCGNIFIVRNRHIVYILCTCFKGQSRQILHIFRLERSDQYFLLDHFCKFFTLTS
jgi:hypothetical protein